MLIALGLCAASFGVTFGITSSQVSREVGSSIGILDVHVLADENLGLYHDPEGSHPLTALSSECWAHAPNGGKRAPFTYEMSLASSCR